MCRLSDRHRSIGIYTTLWAVVADGNHDAKRVALDLLVILISGAPLNHAGRNSTGIWGVNRQGCRFSRPAPWMARGGGPPNHWRITGTPSLSEVPSGGARAFCLLLRFSKVSRCQSGTLGGRYRRNGYVLGMTVSAVRPPSQRCGDPTSQLPHLACSYPDQLGVGAPPCPNRRIARQYPTNANPASKPPAAPIQAKPKWLPTQLPINAPPPMPML